MEVLVHLFEAEVLSFPAGDVCGLDVKHALCQRHSASLSELELTLEGMSLGDQDVVPDEFGLVIRGVLRVRGGKGGYGAMIRHMAKQSGAKKTTDFGACRDLSGRRLRQVNDEIILQKWKDARERGEEMDTDQITQTGIDMWFLAAPSWTDGLSKPHPRKRFMKDRKKTTICIDWERARKERNPPKNAPVWWGCPRGGRCEYAHGEAELPKEAIRELREQRKQAERDKANARRLEYISVGGDDDDRNMSELVLAGLQAAKKLRREATDAPLTVDDSEVTPLHSSEEERADAFSSKSRTVPTASSMHGGNSDIKSADEAIAGMETGEEPTVVLEDSIPSCTWLSILSGEGKDGSTSASKKYLPPSVDMNGTITGNGEEGLGSVAVTGCSLSEGSWYFEVEVLSDGLLQIGVADDSIVVSPADGDGVGDDAHSWSFDGARSCVWHNGKERQYGSGSWKTGDIVGVYVRIEITPLSQGREKKRGRGKSESAELQKRLSLGFSLNGDYLGDAFVSEGSVEGPSQYFYPVVSAESGESAQLNIGQRPFQFYKNDTVLGKSTDSTAQSFQPVLQSLDAYVVASINEYMLFYSSVEKSIGSKEESAQSSNSRADVALHVSDELNSTVVAAQTAPTAVETFDEIDIDSEEFNTAETLHRFGLAHLKADLGRRGLKVGGTLIERANRLFAARNNSTKKEMK